MEKVIKDCEYFTTDESCCNLLCPYILQGKDVKCEDCKKCGYNLVPDDKAC